MTNASDKKILFFNGYVLTFYKAINQKEEIIEDGQFFIWGGLDYLRVDEIQSLSKFHTTDEAKIIKKLGLSPPIEKRQLYLYKDSDTQLDIEDEKERQCDWIFQRNNENPLIVIALVNSENFKQIKARAKEKNCNNHLLFDIFKTLGHGTAVIVFRSRTYERVLNCLITLNELCQNTYSIAGVQNTFQEENKVISKKDFAFSNLLTDDRNFKIYSNIACFA